MPTISSAGWAQKAVAWLCGAVVAGGVAGCGGSHTSTSSTGHASTSSTGSTTGAAHQAKAASTVAAIRRDWTRFFNGSTPAATKIPLLQNGQRFSRVLKAEAASPLAQQAQARVSHVQVTGPDQAKVRYTVLLAGKPVLKDQLGTAVRSGHTWQVGDVSFCQLLRLEGTAPPSCPKG